MQTLLESSSPEQTQQHGIAFGKTLRPGDVVLLMGELGAGKTVFTKGIALGLGVDSDEEIQSPTFTLVHEVGGKIPLIHFDLYRLETEEELLEIGLDDYLDRQAVVVMEWGDKFPKLIPENHFEVRIAHEGPFLRRLTIEKKA